MEVDTKALLHNCKILKSHLDKKTQTLAVIKGNAYGHGMLGVAQVLRNHVDYFAVFDFHDALILRKAGIKNNILVLCPAQKEWFTMAIQKKIELSVTSLDVLQNAVSSVKQNSLVIHINVETGLGRDGFVEGEREKIIKYLQMNKRIVVKGLFTHFMGVESSEHANYTAGQVKKLLEWRNVFYENGFTPLVHASGTAGALVHKEYQLDMCRFGIGLYGLWPSEETREKVLAKDKKMFLKPALSWRARIVEVKKLPEGSCIGYDCTHKLPGASKIAVIPVSYYDGIPRSSSGQGAVLIKGKRAPQLGRVMMNMVVVDVTHIGGVKAGDIATILGQAGKDSITAEEWAKWGNTINYEVVTCINEKIERIYK